MRTVLTNRNLVHLAGDAEPKLVKTSGMSRADIRYMFAREEKEKIMQVIAANSGKSRYELTPWVDYDPIVVDEAAEQATRLRLQKEGVFWR